MPTQGTVRAQLASAYFGVILRAGHRPTVLFPIKLPHFFLLAARDKHRGETAQFSSLCESKQRPELTS